MTGCSSHPGRTEDMDSPSRSALLSCLYGLSVSGTDQLLMDLRGQGQGAIGVMMGRQNQDPHSQLLVHLLAELLHIPAAMSLRSPEQNSISCNIQST
jgi:hypothetical protein